MWIQEEIALQIKRDYSQPFFRRKRRNPIWRNLLLLLMGSVGVGAFLFTRPDLVTTAANRLFGPAQTPTPMPGALAADALMMYQEGDAEGAVAYWAQALAQRPDNVTYLYEQGQLLIDLDRAQEALDNARQILELAPNDPRGYALRARALAWEGNANGAITVAQAGLQLDPQFGPLYAALARAYAADERWRESQEAGLLAIDYAPDDVRSYWSYATALTAVGAHDEAMVELERAIAVNATFLPPYFELAFLYLGANRDQEAIDTYNRILGMQPRNPQALWRQCLAYRKVGEFERSLGLCRDAVAADPEFLPAQYQLGILLYNEYDFPGARDAFAACIEIDAGNLECRYRLGLSHYYIAAETYRVCVEQGSANCAEAASEICATGHGYLREALNMTRTRSDAEADVAIIGEGLNAIASAPACQRVAGVLPMPTQAAPEATPEATEAFSGA